ncbi:YciI family protein [Xanthomonas hortorum]|uniref:YCII-related domain-containing protein n=1 Tax=Xanthomonas hortorum pv. pelargonii TaxID=453602 RepID=A0A6V7CXH2_9XANT|nr:YciI family protein [Xanthomonas hortorum]MCE4353388.1 YciI family protein [Xanthomonas hortorum pv. pelargonii]MCM5525091.1 YciI family protein [Xanthomonas hortorum pv. pelargonii]MCM5536483.1 YciI family protein [Xanthomonas hortorum pv. pelargonii]MCM5540720.1 YciI family protein [Xanthomonas hortorum pv. pelargonii]MCM5544108.1 YciI family protein [Xanthomonas hortorum pv. pelargonii]
MTTRYLVLAMRKPDFPGDVVQPHLDFLDTLRAAGQLEMNGGFSDRTGGAYVLVNLGGLEEAQQIVARDPLVLRDASTLTVYEWNTH